VPPPQVDSLELAAAGGDQWTVVRGDIPGGATIMLADRVIRTEEPIRCGERFTLDGYRVVKVATS
jgi:hypothetical protein